MTSYPIGTCIYDNVFVIGDSPCEQFLLYLQQNKFRMERFFNTAGPQTLDSYTIDPLSRFDLEVVLLMIRQKRYFVLHAPRQTGKTSCMLAYATI